MKQSLTQCRNTGMHAVRTIIFISLLFLMLVSNVPHTYGQGLCPNNLNFSSGYGEWDYYAGTCTAELGSTAPPYAWNWASESIGTTPPAATLTQIVNASTSLTGLGGWPFISSGYDYYGGFPVSPPAMAGFPASSQSLLLNGALGNLTISKAAYIFVPSAYGVKYIGYQYAVVLQDPLGHPFNEMPRFGIYVTDTVTGDTIGCVNFTYVAGVDSGSTVPFTNSTVETDDGNADAYYLPWQAGSINLASVPAGDPVRIVFMVGSCTREPNGHWGYAYIDMSCRSWPDTVYACYPGTDTLPVPPSGFETYDWYQGSTLIDTGRIPPVVTVLSTPTTYMLAMTPYPGFGCPDTLTVTVMPSSTNISGTQTVCQGATTDLSGSGSGTWSSATTTVATIGSGTGVVTGVSAGTTTITYQLLSTGCYATAVVTVNPVADPISGLLTVCAGSTTSLSDTVSGGVWGSVGAAVGTIGSVSGVVTGIAAGTITVFYLLSDGCEVVSTVVTVNPLPTTISGVKAICMGATTSLSDGAAGGTWSSSNTAAATIGSTGIVSSAALGTATISYTLPTGCMTTTVVTVYPTPSNIAGVTTICAGAASEATLTDTVSGGTWSSSNAAIIDIVSSSGGSCIIGGVSGGAATITYTLPGGCFKTITITVNPLPTAITGTFSVCAGSTTDLTDGATGGIWSSTNTTAGTVGSTTGIVTGISPGTTTISYTLTTGCGGAATVVTVNQSPSEITGTPYVCAGATTTLSDSIAGGIWSSSDPTIGSVGSSSGIVTGINYGYAYISYTLSDGCSTDIIVPILETAEGMTGADSVCVGATTDLSGTPTGGYWFSSNAAIATVTEYGGVVTGVSAGTVIITYTFGECPFVDTVITVNPLPGPINGDTIVCAGNKFTLTDSAAGGTWSSSNTTVAGIDPETGAVTVNTAGTTTISYALPTGCFVTFILTANPLPGVITGTMTVCAGATISLTDTVAGGAWSSSNTSVATVDGSGDVTGATTGNGTATISYTNSCGTATATVTVYPLPGIITGTLTVCAGSVTVLTDTVGGGTWSSSNTTVAGIDGSGDVTGASAGTTTIYYTNGCGATSVVVTVNIIPGIITGTMTVCAGATTNLTDDAGGGTWSSSNTAIATVDGYGDVTGTMTGSGTVTITYTNNCGTVTTIVTVYPLPGDITGTTTVCAGLITSLTDAVAGGTWSSSNTAVAGVDGSGNVTGNAAGTATITYANSCSYVTTTVTVAGTGISGASDLCIGSTITLTSVSGGGSWSSSNTSVATVDGSGDVTGVSAGTAVISYSFGTGCIGTDTVTVIDATSSCVCYYASIGGTVTELDPGGTGVLAPGVYAAGPYYLTHSVVINGNVTILSSVADMASGISITVNSGGYLTIEGSHLYCCNPNMWSGIILSTSGGTGPTGQLEVYADTNGITSLIEDAKTAVTIQSPLPMPGYLPGAAGNFTLYLHGCTLNKNITGISITGDNSTMGPVPGDPLLLNPSYPYVIENTVITSRDFYGYTSGGLPWPFVWPTTTLLESHVGTATPYEPPYYINTGFATTATNSGIAALTAVDVENTGYTNTAGGIGNEVYSGVVIGGNYTPNVVANMNLFDYMQYGLYAMNSNVVTRNTAYMNMTPSLGTGGYGIYAFRTLAAALANSLYKLDVFGVNPGSSDAAYLAGYTNKFWTQNIHVYASDLYNVRGIYSLMNSKSAPKTKFGYEVSSSEFYDIKLDYNMLFNILNGISNIITPPVVTANQLVGEVSAANNQISSVNPAGGYPAHGEYVNEAISEQNLVGVLVIVPGSEINLDSNTIKGVYNGIYMSNSNNPYQTTTTDYNTITITRNTAGPALQIGIEHVNTISDFIDENDVTGPGYDVPAPVPPYGSTPTIEGIHVATSQKQWTECNNVKKINTGFYFGGTNHTIVWVGNTMNQNSYGYALDGVIGDQPGYGGPTTTGNEWLPSGFWTGTKWQTYTTGGTISTASAMWVNSVVATQLPTNNGADVGTFPYTSGTSILGTVNPADACMSPNPTTVAEIVIHVMGAQKTIPFADNIGPKDWIAQMATYQATTTDSLIDTTAVLQAFNTMATSQSRYKGISEIEANLSAGNYATAQTMVTSGLDGMASTDSDAATGAALADGAAANSVVNNYKEYYYLLIKCETDTLNSTDSAAIVALANMCPYVDGSVVYQARALYSYVFNVLQIFNDAGCDPDAGGDERAMATGDSTASPGLAKGEGLQQYKLFPNPNDGNLTVVQLVPDAQPVSAEILNATGISVYNGAITFENGTAQLSMVDKIPGLYMLNLTDSKGRKFMLKFVIE